MVTRAIHLKSGIVRVLRLGCNAGGGGLGYSPDMIVSHPPAARGIFAAAIDDI